MYIKIRIKNIPIKSDNCEFKDLKPGDLFQWKWDYEAKWGPDFYLMLDPTHTTPGQCIKIAGRMYTTNEKYHCYFIPTTAGLRFRTFEKSKELDVILQAIISSP